jgi:flagellar biogenesis protein FliO
MIGVVGLLSCSTFAQDELPNRTGSPGGHVVGRCGLQGEDLWSSVPVGLPSEDGQGAGAEARPSGSGVAPPRSGAAESSRELVRRPSSGPSFLRAQSSNERAGSSWLRTTGALAAVVALIFLLGWGYRAMTSGRLPFSGRAKHPGLIEVISRTGLSPKHSLHLVRVGPRLVLVGMSSEALTALDVVDDADTAARLAGRVAIQRSDAYTRGFTQCLESEAAGYRGPDEGLDETIAPEEGRFLNVKQQLSGTIQRVRAAVGGA